MEMHVPWFSQPLMSNKRLSSSESDVCIVLKLTFTSASAVLNANYQILVCDHAKL